MFSILFRTLIIYIVLILVMRLMGKRQVGELQLSELVTTFLLSDIAAAPITNSNIPLLFAIIPILILLSLEVILSFAVTKSNFLKKVFDGVPTVLISKGELIQSELARSRISLDELISQLRLKNVSDINEVLYAILEPNGQLSVIPKSDYAPVVRKDLNIPVDKTGISHSLIIDTKISTNNLNMLNLDEEWLIKKLKKLKLDISDVFLFSVDDTGKETVIRKTKK